jgi:hypothetical protein
MNNAGSAWTSRRAPNAGSIFGRFVTSSDVHETKLRLNATVEALDKLVATCPDMPPVLVAGWNAFSTSWKTFLQTKEGFWSAGAEMDQAEAYAAEITQWQDKLSKAPCKGSAPSPYAPPPPADLGGGAEKDTKDLAKGAISGVTTIATIGLVGYLLYLVDKHLGK